MPCLFITSSAAGPCCCCFHMVPTIVAFFCLRSASFRACWSSCHLWQYNLYSYKAAKRDITQLTNKFVGLININLARSSQKKMNQLLLNCCISAFIVTKETQLKFLTTFLKKHNLLITCRSFLTTQSLYSHGQKSIFVCEATCSAVLHQKSFVIASSFVMSESVMQDTVVRVWCKILFHVINSQPFNSEFFFCFFVIIFLPQNG